MRIEYVKTGTLVPEEVIDMISFDDVRRLYHNAIIKVNGKEIWAL